MDNQTVETLEAARDLISDPRNWTKKTYARDKSGCVVNATSSEAVCWCSIGALLKVSPKLLYADRASGFLLRTLKTGFISIFNDDDRTTHSQVIEKFNEAIELAKKEV